MTPLVLLLTEMLLSNVGFYTGLTVRNQLTINYCNYVKSNDAFYEFQEVYWYFKNTGYNVEVRNDYTHDYNWGVALLHFPYFNSLLFLKKQTFGPEFHGKTPCYNFVISIDNKNEIRTSKLLNSEKIGKIFNIRSNLCLYKYGETHIFDSYCPPTKGDVFGSIRVSANSTRKDY